jgi:AraC family transcriptional regulator, regulatory protein of adaptative response / methylated-DNA-[protein]-cysteine methyltransferase
MMTTQLPSQAEMLSAFMAADASYDGVFVTAVRTTGIFCRASCTARKPKAQNIEFYPTAAEAKHAGYRACKRCRPLDFPGQEPDWLTPLLARLDEEPTRRWTDADLREAGLHPDRVRRWFKTTHGTTFHAFARARRLGLALHRVQDGAPVARVAFEHGYESLSGFNAAFRELLGAAPTSTTAVPLFVQRLATPLGPMVAAASDDGLYLLEFSEPERLEPQVRRLGRRLEAQLVPGTNEILTTLASELGEYFEAKIQSFSVPLCPLGTPFQLQVWKQLRQIPYGTTCSYREVADAIGRPTAVRAVAGSNGDNRLAIVIPCHRVIGADGSPTGYGGGVWRKQRLLELEG